MCNVDSSLCNLDFFQSGTSGLGGFCLSLPAQAAREVGLLI